MTNNELSALLVFSGIGIFFYFKKQNDLLKAKEYRSFKTPNIDSTNKENIKTQKIAVHENITLTKNREILFNELKIPSKTNTSPQNKENSHYTNPYSSNTEATISDYNRAYGELLNLGCKPIHDGDKLAFRVSKSLDGRWFYCKKSGLNSQKDRVYLTLNKMPYLQTLLLKIELNDPLLKIQGGRVLISYNGHYRKNLVSSQIRTFQVN